MTAQPIDAALRRRRRRARVRRNVFRAIPFAVWILALLAFSGLWSGRFDRLPMRAMAEVSRYSVASPSDGEIRALLVGPGDSVRSGQLVARIDDERLRLRLTRARHELERVRASLLGQESRLLLESRNDEAEQVLDRERQLNRLTRELEEARIDRLETIADIEEARIEERGAKEEFDRSSGLRAQGLESAADIVRTRTRYESLAKRSLELNKILEARDARVQSIQARRTRFAESTGARPNQISLQLAPLQWRIREQEVELEELGTQLAACELKAPADGVVATTLRRGGEFVRRGEIIVQIVQPQALSVTAYVPQELEGMLAPGTGASFEIRNGDGSYRRAPVLAVSPELVPVPAQLLSDPRVPEWALAIRLQCTGEERPGQSVPVFLRRP